MYKKIKPIHPYQTILLTLALSFSFLAKAHDQEGNLAGPANIGATDIFSINCYNDQESSQEPTYQLYATIRNNVKSEDVLSLVISKKTNTGWLSKSTSDITGGDYSTSPAIMINGGEGEYLAFIHHTGTTPLTYLLQYHCQDKQNQHTGTQIQTLQNE